MAKSKDKVVGPVEMEKHFLRLWFQEPFYGYVSRSLNKRVDNSIPTAGVSIPNARWTLVWNDKYVGGLSDRKVTGLLKHEIHHLIWNHVTSRRRDPHDMWNIATDAAINSLLEADQVHEDWILPGREKDRNSDNPVAQALGNLPTGLSADVYFNKLMEAIPPEQRDPNAGFVAEVLSGSGDHSQWGDSDDSEEVEIAREDLKQILRGAAQTCDEMGSWGSVSAEMQAQIREFISNTIDWKKLLRKFVGFTQRANRASSIKRINRRYPMQFPGIKRGHTAKIVIYVDQSGSVSNKELELLFAEVRTLSRTRTFDVIFFDHTVDENSHVTWNRGTSIRLGRTRGGGTSFDAAVEHFNKNHKKFEWDGMLICTDGECSRPRVARKRLGWVITPDRKLQFPPRSNEIIINMDWPKAG
jgi:predicted metal-dependent peptidase